MFKFKERKMEKEAKREALIQKRIDEGKPVSPFVTGEARKTLDEFTRIALKKVANPEKCVKEFYEELG